MMAGHSVLIDIRRGLEYAKQAMSSTDATFISQQGLSEPQSQVQQRPRSSFRNFQSLDSTLVYSTPHGAAQARAVGTSHHGRDQIVGTRAVGRVRVNISLQKTTRWIAGRVNSDGKASGLLVLRIQFIQDGSYELQWASGSIDFPAGTALERIEPRRGLRGSPVMSKISSENEIKPQIEASNMFNAGGIGTKWTKESTREDQWRYVVEKDEIDANDGLFRRLWWKLHDQKCGPSGVFDRSVHTFAELLFIRDPLVDDPKPIPVTTIVTGRLRSIRHELRRKIYKTEGACTRHVTPAFTNNPLIVDDEINKLIEQVMQENRTLPELIEDRSCTISTAEPSS